MIFVAAALILLAVVFLALASAALRPPMKRTRVLWWLVASFTCVTIGSILLRDVPASAVGGSLLATTLYRLKRGPRR